VWAVGNYYNSSHGRTETLTEHWNGASWSFVSSQNQGSNGDNFLQEIAAGASNDVWTVGYYVSASAHRQTLMEHWNGTAWSIISSPNQGVDDTLSGITVVSASNAWTVGSYLIADNNATVDTLVEHWNGTAWTVVSSPNQPAIQNFLYGVTAISAGDVWAVGESGDDSSDTSQTLVEHWNGTMWTIVPSPSAGSHTNPLERVDAISANDIWAVGYYESANGYATMTEHWDGSSWSLVSSPNPGSWQNYLYDVAAISATEAWAVGYSLDNGGYPQTLIEHNAGCNNATATTTPIATSTASQATATATTCTITFTDVPPGSTFYPFIHCLACLGIINGYSDGTFKPNNQVTRGQLSKIVANSAGFSDSQPNQMFQDVPLGSTFQVFIGRLASRGYINGYPCGGPDEPCQPGNLPYFRPGNNATMGQTSKIVGNTFFPDCQSLPIDNR